MSSPNSDLESRLHRNNTDLQRQHLPVITMEDSETALVKYLKLKIGFHKEIAQASAPQLESNTSSFDLDIGLPGRFLENLSENLRDRHEEVSRPDQRIQNFLSRFLRDIPGAQDIRLPTRGEHFVMEEPGLARVASFPEHGNYYESLHLKSYKLLDGQGVLHNPKNAQRTTDGSFWVAEGGLPIPADKIAVPRERFAEMLRSALNPPEESLTLPFSLGTGRPVKSLVSLYLRPVVSPEIPGVSVFPDGTAPCKEKCADIRFFAPAGFVSNLDFVETIFGNAGNPYVHKNDASLNPEHWSGQTGCVILAPHLAAEFNGGNAFKICARDESGVMVTLIADNYFGYSKKEVKTQISFDANLCGGGSERHSGGARAFRRTGLGDSFNGTAESHSAKFSDVQALKGHELMILPEGYAHHPKYPQVLYIPENARMDAASRTIQWTSDGKTTSIQLKYDHIYFYPSGFRVQLERDGESKHWRLIGTSAGGPNGGGILVDKDFTESGGGKSEISKRISNAVRAGPHYIVDLERDLDAVDQLLAHDYSTRFNDGRVTKNRSILSADRSLGSVIKLLTRSDAEFTSEYNQWLETIPDHIRRLVFTLKALYKPSMGTDWRKHFSVDDVDGKPGNELKFDNRKLSASYLRVGFAEDGEWRYRSLRADFEPAHKIQTADDITAVRVVPAHWVRTGARASAKQFEPNLDPSLIFVKNTETRLFQRPDDGIVIGFDKETENDFGNIQGQFYCNYQPLNVEAARALLQEPQTFERFSAPMQGRILRVARSEVEGYWVSSSQPVLDAKGKPSKNPRYLQLRPDLRDDLGKFLAEEALRLAQMIPSTTPLLTPVTDLLPGQRLNAPDFSTGIRALAAFGPIHYLDTPELFMKVIASLTGKSPSTTGAGSEGALTKGPFNAILPIHDLNDRLVTYLLANEHAFISATGFLGPKCRVDHDISLIMPELWVRMSKEERDPGFLIKTGCLERVPDTVLKENLTVHSTTYPAGSVIQSSRLGWRITPKFVNLYFGRLFNCPNQVFTPEMLRPELQGLEAWVDAVQNIVEAQRKVAENYFKDGSIDRACPQLKALLHIMRDGHFNGKDLNHPDIRALFSREYLLQSEYYGARLNKQQEVDVKNWSAHVENLEAFMGNPTHLRTAVSLGIEGRLLTARTLRDRFASSEYRRLLEGAIGRDPGL